MATNPILQMLSGQASPNNMMGGFNPANFPFARLQEFVGLMRGRNPEQLLQNFIRQYNISDGQYQQAANMATQVCQMFGLK